MRAFCPLAGLPCSLPAVSLSFFVCPGAAFFAARAAAVFVSPDPACALVRRIAELPMVLPRKSSTQTTPKQSGTITLIYGMPPMSRTIANFLKSDKATQSDRKAAKLLQHMTFEEDHTASYESLERLKTSGSKLAAHLLAIRDLESPEEAVRTAARDSLRSLADQSFLPSVQQLFGSLTAQDLGTLPDPDGTLFERLLKGADAGSLHCRYLLGSAWLEGTILPEGDLPDVICDMLLESALQRSWDCLRLLFLIYSRFPPDMVNLNHMDIIRNLLLRAAGSGCAEAMHFMGSLVHTDALMNDDLAFEEAEHWHTRALELGYLESGCSLASMLMLRAGYRADDQYRDVDERDPDMIRARKILEHGCSQMHAHSHVLLADYYSTLDDRLHHRTIMHLLCTAARLGMTAPYVNRVLGSLYASSGNPSGRLRLLEQPFLKNDPATKLALAVWQVHSWPDRKSVTRAMKTIEQLANEAFAPACAALAELHSYDFSFFREKDTKRAFHVAKHGALQLHNDRCLALHSAFILDACEHTENAGMDATEMQAWHRILFLCPRGEWLARAVFACKMALDYMPARRKDLIFPFGDNLEEEYDSLAGLLADCIDHGIDDRDSTVLNYIARELLRAADIKDPRQRKETDNVANLCGEMVGVKPDTCRSLGDGCRMLAAGIWDDGLLDELNSELHLGGRSRGTPFRYYEVRPKPFLIQKPDRRSRERQSRGKQSPGRKSSEKKAEGRQTAGHAPAKKRP